MPTLNFYTKAQRRNVINMPSRATSSTRLHIGHCHQPGCQFVAIARSLPSMTCSLGYHIVSAHQPPTAPEAA